MLCAPLRPATISALRYFIDCIAKHSVSDLLIYVRCWKRGEAVAALLARRNAEEAARADGIGTRTLLR